MTDLELQREDARIRGDFPLLADRDVAYLDNSATTQKPATVLRAVREYYEHHNANPLRGLYKLAVDATEEYEAARAAAAEFIHAPAPENIVFTRNASESLNLIAYSYGMHFIKAGDEILVSALEHHSNFLPWLNVAKATGAVVKFLDCDRQGIITAEDLRAALTPRTRLVAITHVSNALGVKNDLKTFAKICHESGAVLVGDGAQSVPHMPVDVQDLDVDFFVFSGHKMCAPMGIGVLYGKMELLEKMPPFMYGGEMIEYVTREGATYAPVPHKFEAGTVNAGGAVGLAAAIRYYQAVGWDVIERRERDLTELLFSEMKKIPHVHILGSDDPANHHGIISFTLDGVHPHDIAAIFDEDNVNVRAGHHCAQPLLKFLGLTSTTRASLAFYNNRDDVMRFVESLKKIRRKMGYND